MYRCATCKAVVPDSTPRLTHAVLRADGSVARELPVCALCHAVLLGGGVPVNAPPSPATDPNPRPTKGD